MINRFSGVRVRADHIEIHGIFRIGFHIEGIQPVGQLVITELLSVNIAGLKKRAEADIAGILTVSFIVADHPPDLP